MAGVLSPEPSTPPVGRLALPRRNLVWLACACGLAVILGAAVTASRPPGPGAFWRLLVAMLAVGILPGHALLSVAGERIGRASVDLWEWLTGSFGLSFCIVSTICAVALTARASLAQTVWALLLFSSLLLGVIAWRERGNRAPQVIRWSPVYLPFVVSGLLLALVSSLLYGLGGLGGAIPTPEGGLDVVVTGKILKSTALVADQLSYRPPATPEQGFPAYPFFLAAVAWVSGLEPLVVFAKLRFAWGVIALLSLYAVIKRLFGNPSLAHFSLLIFLGLALAGRAAGGPDLFSLLAPLSPQADWSLGVLLPVALAFLLRLLGREPSSRLYWVATPMLLLLASITRPGASAQLGLYLSLLLGCALGLRDRQTLRRLAYFAAALGLLILAYRGAWTPRGLRLDLWSALAEAPAREALARCGESPAECLFSSPAAVAREWLPLSYEYFVLALTGAPLLLLSSRVGSLFVALAALAPLAVLSAPFLYWGTSLLVGAGSGLAPVPLVLHPAYLLVALLLYLVAAWVDRISLRIEERVPQLEIKAWVEDTERAEPDHMIVIPTSSPFTILALGGLTALLLAGGHLLRKLASGQIGTLVLLALGLSLSLIAYRVLGGSFRIDSLLEHRFRSGGRALALTSIVVLALLFNPQRPDPELGLVGGSLVGRYREATRQTDIARLGEWYEAHRYLDVPFPMIQFIRSLPPGQMLAFPLDGIERLAVIGNQYVFAYGSFRPTEVELTELYARLRGLPLPEERRARARELARIYREEMFNRFPLYNEQDPPELSLMFLQQLGVDYVPWKVRGRGSATGGRDLPDRLPGRFEMVFESGRYALYRVKP